MVPALSSVATRRIETASKPSASAIAIAVSAICSRVKRGRRLPGAGVVQTGPSVPLDISYSVLLTSPYDVRTEGTAYDGRTCDPHGGTRQALWRPLGPSRPRPRGPDGDRPRPPRP